MKFSDLDIDAQLDVPRDVGRALKAFAKGRAGKHQQILAYRFIVEGLGARDQLLFRPYPNMDVGLMMAWLDGRRFVGLQMERIVAAPMTDAPEPELPPARTMTERVARRNSTTE